MLLLLMFFAFASAQDCHLNGRCVRSDLIKLTAAASTTECLQDCKNFPGCQWYSYKQRTRTTCQLFSNCNELSMEDCDYCESGQVGCQLYTCDQLGFCVGFLLDTLKVSSQQDCLAKCKTMQDCHWISYGVTESMNECLLYQTCDTINNNDAGYISSQAECQSKRKMLVTTSRQNTVKSYVIDVTNGTICDKFPEYPDTNGVYSPGSGLLKNKYPFVCDGNWNKDINDCYIFEDGQWNKNVSLPEPSRWSGSTILNGTILWIAGNTENWDFNMKLSLLVNPFESLISPGPELPYGVRSQCMINIDEDRVMFIGGSNGTIGHQQISLDKTRTYSFAQNSWETGPSLTEPRLTPACALLTIGSNQVIFVASGTTSEYLELNGDNKWKVGPSLPDIGVGKMVSTEGYGTLLFGNNHFLKLVCDNDPNQCKWKPLDYDLPNAVYSEPVAMIIPDDITPECH